MILTLTPNPALDVYTTVEKIAPDEKMRCAPPKKDPGGGGVNVSRVIKRLGGESVAVYSKGGYTGKFFFQLLEEEQIKQDPVAIRNDLRQNFAATEASTGHLFRFGMPGAELDASETEALLDKIDQYPQVKFLVGSGSLPPGVPDDFYAQVSKKAKSQNIKFIADTSGPALSAVLREGAYLIKPNIKELQALTGYQVDHKEDQKQLLLQVLKDHNVEVIVASLGAEGALVATNGRVRHYEAPIVEHLSSIGAGDSMVAGITFGLSNGEGLEKAVLRGLACGSATIKSPGTELLTREDVDYLYTQLLRKARMNEG